MSLKVLIVPDKFKGTLTARAAAEAIASGWHKARPGDELTLLPMSDGGDGFGEIFSSLLRAARQTIRTIDAAHRRVRAKWWFARRTRTAIVDSANVIGLAMLPPGAYHPFDLDTFGLGSVLMKAASRGARHCLVGIGGSATNDGGFGLARALGWRFLNDNGELLKRWIELDRLDQIVAPKRSSLKGMKIVVAVDVQNPLLGKAGASRVFGPQKGLRRQDFSSAERCLGRLASVMKRQSGRDFASIPGAGAAGGLGFGLAAFAGASMESGIRLFSHHARLQERLRSADLVITGEGSIDRSTLMGKGVGDIAQLCLRFRIPCIGMAGVLGDEREIRRRFTDVDALIPRLTSRREAYAQPSRWLKRLAERVSNRWHSPVHSSEESGRRRRPIKAVNPTADSGFPG